MIRYWFKFDFEHGDKIPYGIIMGCGVTAFNYNDALELLQTRVFKTEHVPKIKEMVENIDVSTLDPGHVLPNMAPPNIRGIWFPLGFEY